MRALLKAAVLLALLGLLAWLVAKRVAEQRASPDRPPGAVPAGADADTDPVVPAPLPDPGPDLVKVRVTSAGRPAAHVPVAFLDWATRVVLARGRTDADGSFSAQVPTGADALLAAGEGETRTLADPAGGSVELGRGSPGIPDAPAGFLGALLDPSEAGSGAAPAPARAPPGGPTGTVRGSAWLSRGRPAEGARVVAVAGRSEVRATVAVDRDGTFTFEETPGARRLYLVPRHDPGAVQVLPVVVRAGAETRGDFGTERGWTLRGRVGQRERPLAGVPVEFGGSQGEGRTVLTDRQGRWRLEGVGPGHLRARATVSGVRHVRRLRVREQDLIANWVLPDTRWSGVLRDAAGAPLAGREITLARQGGWPAPTPEREYEGTAAATTDERGGFRFEALPEGTYRWRAGNAEGTVVLREGEPLALDLRAR